MNWKEKRYSGFKHGDKVRVVSNQGKANSVNNGYYIIGQIYTLRGNYIKPPHPSYLRHHSKESWWDTKENSSAGFEEGTFEKV